MSRKEGGRKGNKTKRRNLKYNNMIDDRQAEALRLMSNNLAE